MSNIYIKVDIQTAIDDLYLDVAGVMNCVERIECDTTSGVRVFETRNKDVIDNLKLIESNEILSLEGPARVMVGTRGNAGIAGVGITAHATDTKTFIIPLVNTPLDNKYWPMFGNDGLRFRIHWASALNFVIEDATTDVVAGSFNISGVRMHYDSVRLNEPDMLSLRKEVNDRFVITGNAYQNQQEVSTSTAVIANLGFGRTKCKRIYVALRNTAALSSNVHSSHSFDCATLLTAELRHKGILVNQSGLTFSVGNQATVLAEIFKQKGIPILKSVGIMEPSTFELAIPTATYAAAVGTFFIAFDLTSGADTHLSESGLDTRTGTFQLGLTSGSALAHTIDIFCEYETKIVLDMATDKVFRVMS